MDSAAQFNQYFPIGRKFGDSNRFEAQFIRINGEPFTGTKTY